MLNFTRVQVDLEIGDSAHPARVLVRYVAPELAAIRQPDVGDLKHPRRHNLHSVVEHQRLVILQPGDRCRRRRTDHALEDGRLAEEQVQADRLAVEAWES